MAVFIIMHVVTLLIETIQNERSARRRHKHCTLAVVRWSQKFRPTADPSQGCRTANI